MTVSRRDRLFDDVGREPFRRAALAEVLDLIEAAYDEKTAIAWLFGMNVALGDRAPIEVLREGGYDDASAIVRLARDLVAGGGGWR